MVSKTPYIRLSPFFKVVKKNPNKYFLYSQSFLLFIKEKYSNIAFNIELWVSRFLLISMWVTEKEYHHFWRRLSCLESCILFQYQEVHQFLRLLASVTSSVWGYILKVTLLKSHVRHGTMLLLGLITTTVSQETWLAPVPEPNTVALGGKISNPVTIYNHKLYFLHSTKSRIHLYSYESNMKSYINNTKYQFQSNYHKTAVIFLLKCSSSLSNIYSNYYELIYISSFKFSVSELYRYSFWFLKLYLL